MPTLRSPAVSLVLLALMSGCGNQGPKTQVTSELKRVTGGLAAFSFEFGRPLVVLNTTSAVTVESFQIPVRSIALVPGDSLNADLDGDVVYSCNSSEEANCRVELVGGALQNLFSDVMGTRVHSVSQDTYSFVRVDTCFGGQAYTALVKAYVTLNGTVWYTQAGSEYLTSNQSEYGTASLSFGNCLNDSVLASPLVVGASPLTLSLFFDLRNVAVANLPAGPDLTTPEVCTRESAPSGSAPYLCVRYPGVAAAAGTQNVSTERYRVTRSDSATAATVLGLYFDSDSGAPLSGYVRPYFDASFTAAGMFPSAFKFARLVDSKLLVTDLSGTNVGSVSGFGDFTVDDFPRLTAGATRSGLAYKDHEGGTATTTYSLYRLD